MGKQDLYAYLINHQDDMINQWLNMKEYKEGSIYSLDASADMKATLVKQNRQLIQSLASILIQSDQASEQELVDWVSNVVIHRVKTATSLTEWLRQFRSFRDIFWDKVSTYIGQTDSISKDTILKWTDLFYKTFNHIIQEFIEQYQELTEKQLQEHQMLIRELSSPVIPITKRVGVLPLIGKIDTARAELIMESTLRQCEEKAISHLFLDFSGVHLIDTTVADETFKVVKPLQLLGVETTISGIRPEIAQSIIQLGIDFTDIPIKTTLHQALYESGLMQS